MPRISDSVPINNPSLDRRVKLTDEQREQIRNEYNAGDTSYQKLADEYGVSKRLVMFIVNPDKEIIAREQFKQRQKDGRYYNKEEHTKQVKEHRDYKKKLYEEGKI